MEKKEKPKSEEEKDKASERPEQPEDIVPPEEETILPKEVLEKLPPESRAMIQKSISMVMAGSMPPPSYYITKKITSEQIGKIIDHAESESQRDHKERMSTRRWNFAYMIGGLLFILLLSTLFLWRDKAEYMAPIITALVGGAGGYGIGLSQGQKRAQ